MLQSLAQKTSSKGRREQVKGIVVGDKVDSDGDGDDAQSKTARQLNTLRATGRRRVKHCGWTTGYILKNSFYYMKRL